MKVLLDTCTFLWWVSGDDALSETATRIVADPEHEVWLSAVSIWETVVKHGLGRLVLPEPPDRLLPRLREQHGIETLALTEQDVLQYGRLPALHRDPFDRMLVCQAIARGMLILTPDEAIRQYPVRTEW